MREAAANSAAAAAKVRRQGQQVAGVAIGARRHARRWEVVGAWRRALSSSK